MFGRLVQTVSLAQDDGVRNRSGVVRLLVRRLLRRARSVGSRRARGVLLVEVAAEARIEEVAVVAQREPDRIVEGALRDVVSSRESAVVNAPHWPEDEDGFRDRPSAVQAIPSAP